VLAEHIFELLSTDCGTWTKLDFARAPCMQVLTTAPSCTGTWTKLDLALAPKTGTDCVGIEVDSDPGGSLRVSPGPSKATRAFGVADGLPSA
jgi:hypothetical protein